MRVFAIGDIHGAHKSLIQCIERSGINKEKDQLIVLGDVVDGWNEVPECVETLLEFKNLILIIGNHDFWFMEWCKTGVANHMWKSQGGNATISRYIDELELRNRHMGLYFNHTNYYYIDDERKSAFMHGGYDWTKPLKDNSNHDIMWDRSMVSYAQAYGKQIKFEKNETNIKLQENKLFNEFDKIFVGHTTTQHSFNWRYQASFDPAFLGNLINLDTGGGWDGKLTIMDVDSLGYWQSDLVTTLYDEVNARR